MPPRPDSQSHTIRSPHRGSHSPGAPGPSVLFSISCPGPDPAQNCLQNLLQPWNCSDSVLSKMVATRHVVATEHVKWGYYDWRNQIFFKDLFADVYGGSLLLCAGFLQLQCMGFSLPGFSCCGARVPGTWASVVVSRGLSSCGSWTLGHMGLVALPHVGSSLPRDGTCIFCIGRWFLTTKHHSGPEFFI